MLSYTQKVDSTNIWQTVLKFHCNKTKLDDKLKIYYECKHGKYISCDISIKNIAACILKGHHLKRNIYLPVMSTGLSDMIWRVFAAIMSLTNEKNKKLSFCIDSILINIFCDHKLLLNRITYFDDVILRLDNVKNVDYRGKICYHVNAYICQGNIMLAAKINIQLLLMFTVFLLLYFFIVFLVYNSDCTS